MFTCSFAPRSVAEELTHPDRHPILGPLNVNEIIQETKHLPDAEKKTISHILSHTLEAATSILQTNKQANWTIPPSELLDFVVSM